MKTLVMALGALLGATPSGAAADMGGASAGQVAGLDSSSATGAATSFPHEKHLRLFPQCVACHPGAAAPGASFYPEESSCRTCHDGTVRPRVEFTLSTRPPSPVNFDHQAHAARLRDRNIVAASCRDCHSTRGANPMEVHPVVSARCFECHKGPEHFADESECITCHSPLAQMPHLPGERVAGFPKPPSHSLPGFALEKHGKIACPSDGAPNTGTTSSCAVCHAQQFCETCHVDAAERDCIQQLGTDERSLLIRAPSRHPASHEDASFLKNHGHMAQDLRAECGTCHTQSSCRVCHAATPGVASSLVARPSRSGVGAQVVRVRPPSHGTDFRNHHGTQAATNPAECAACHHRAQCLDCHRSDPAAGNPGYHPADFLARHPSAAYSRETSCADCHNPASFCKTCHDDAGLTSQGQILGAGYHDAQREFILGHGPAARMNLESCVSCHAEQDCLVCHSSLGGRGFNPHGPDLDAAKLREKAPQMCTVCHGARIPK